MSLPAFVPARLPWLAAIAAQLAQGWPERPSVPPVLPEIACIAALGLPCPALAAGRAAHFLSLAPLVAAGGPARPPGRTGLPPVPPVLPEFPCIAALGPPWPARPPELAAP